MSKIIIAIIIILIAGLGYWIYQSVSGPQEITEAEAKNCEVDSDCLVFGQDGDCNCGCFNKNYSDWQAGGACFCAAPKSCKCVNGKCEGVFEENKEEACLKSGGQLRTSLCCKSTGDYPNLCLIGPCGCSPDNSHQVKICDCGEDKCFDGTACVFRVFSFDECLEAGYPVMESYPRQCRTPDNRTFVEDIGNELEKIDLIMLDNPRPNQIVESPLTIEGQARGFWFFEADFPIKLFDSNNQLIGSAIAQAKGEWMTEDFVPFSAVLGFEIPTTDKGWLVLEKDNPSGLEENADELKIPVKFK